MKTLILIAAILSSACGALETQEQPRLAVADGDVEVAIWLRFYVAGSEVPCSEAPSYEIAVRSRLSGPQPRDLQLVRCSTTLAAPEHRVGSAVYRYVINAGAAEHVVDVNGLGHVVSLSTSETGMGSAWRFISFEAD